MSDTREPAIDPVVQTVTTYRCPRCDREFRTRGLYAKHCEYCNDETIAEAVAMIGSWVWNGQGTVEFVGKVVGNDGTILIARGYELASQRADGEYASAILKTCRGLPSFFKVLSGEDEAFDMLSDCLISRLGIAWNTWTESMEEGPQEQEAERI